MRKYNITLLLLFFELSCMHGHAIVKREAIDSDVYEVREDKDTLEIINPKAKTPTLREILYYHVIEKPYPGKNVEINEDNGFKPKIHDVTRPFTNGHGFQYLDENNHVREEPSSLEDKENEHYEPIHDENEAKFTPRDENEADLARRNETDKLNDRIEDEIPNGIERDKVINDKEDRPIPEIEEMRRRKRDIDYSKLPPPPPLPPFRMDILPDYIKNILPTENDLLSPKIPNFEPETTKTPEVLNNIKENPEKVRGRTERPQNVYGVEDYEVGMSSEENGIDEAEIPRISIRIGGDETHDEQIPIKPHEIDHKITKKSARNGGDEIEKEIQDLLQRVINREEHGEGQDPSFYGMELIGDGGIVWNDLNNQHSLYNVGSGAINAEVYDEQNPAKPHAATNNEENKEITNDIATALDELDHILEEIMPNNENVHENYNTNEGTTESNDIEIIFHKNKPQTNKEENDNNEHKTPNEKEFKPKIDPRSSFGEDDHIKPKNIDTDGSIDLETALNILEVIQEIVANPNDSGPNDDGNKDSNVKSKDETSQPEKATKDEKSNVNEGTTSDIEIIIHNNKPQVQHKEINDQKDKSLNLKQFESKIDPRSTFNDDNKIESKTIDPENSIDLETALNILEVLQEIVANSNDSGPKNDGNKDSNVKSKDEPSERDRKHKHKGKGDKDGMEDLLNNDKYWQWLKDSSEATLNLFMKKANGLIKEEVEKQIQELIPKMLEEQGKQPGAYETNPIGENETKTDDDKVETDLAAEESDIDPQVLDKLKKNDKWKWLTNSSETYLGELMKRLNQLIKEQVTKEAEHFIKDHMSSGGHNESSNNINNSNQNGTESIEANPEKDASKENTDEELKNKEIKTDDKEKTSKSAKDDLKTKPTKVKKDKGHKPTLDEGIKHSNKHTDKKKDPLIKINAQNSYGSSVGNEKVTNIFIFNLNGTDLKNLKPISSGNGMFIFGTENNTNNTESSNNNGQEISEKPDVNEKETDGSNVDSTTDSNKDDNTTTPEDTKPVSESKPNLGDDDKNKDENTTTTTTTEGNTETGENNKEDETDSSSKETEKVSEYNKEKEIEETKPSVENETKDDAVETASKNDEKSEEIPKPESDDEKKDDSSKDAKSEDKNDDKDSEADEKVEAKSKSKDETN